MGRHRRRLRHYDHKDLGDVIYRNPGDTGAELLFSATENALKQLIGSERHYPPLT